MNPLLSKLQPYPFERLRLLHTNVAPNPAYTPISLGIGEPRHAAPQLIKDAITHKPGRAGQLPWHAGLGSCLLRQVKSH